MLPHLRVLRPHENIYAFYDGRIPGYRFANEKNWIDDGALSLGIASYAIISGDEALIYDTHVSIEHATAIHSLLSEKGIKHFTVVLSHWHLDHIVGTSVFADCTIISTQRTANHLIHNKKAIEAGSLYGAPALSPLILPTQTFTGQMTLRIGSLVLELIETQIHSDDAAVIWLGNQSILLAGDTMEDTITYVCEPECFDTHLDQLDRLWTLNPTHILPNHGNPDIISSGGYKKTLIRATQQYIRILKRCATDRELCTKPLRELIKGPLDIGWISYFEAYETVHRQNIEKIQCLS
jgi:glyoxylase-like metal-dependent hydrolase (beta-lactamase superfamily II)